MNRFSREARKRVEITKHNIILTDDTNIYLDLIEFIGVQQAKLSNDNVFSINKFYVYSSYFLILVFLLLYIVFFNNNNCTCTCK